MHILKIFFLVLLFQYSTIFASEIEKLSLFPQTDFQVELTNQADLKEKQFNYKVINSIEQKLFWQLLIVAVIIVIFFYIRGYNIKKLNIELQRRVEEELKKSRDKDKMISHQNKLIAMGEMIENIAHQWRQPLSQVNSAVLIIDDIMHEKKYKNVDIEEKLLEIESLTNYMSSTIDDFRNFFNRDKVRNKFCVNQVIENAIYLLKGILKVDNIEIIYEVEEELFFNGYKSELEQVIVIILNNAIDVFKQKKIKDKKIIINLNKTENIMICIDDNAGGIDSKIINKIFDPYFTTKHKSQGTGLGLYMSKMIVENSLGGSLEVLNIDTGASFIIRLDENIIC